MAALLVMAGVGWMGETSAQDVAGLEVQTAGHGEPELIFLSDPDAPGDAWDHVVARFEVAYRCHVVAPTAWANRSTDALAGAVAAYVRTQGLGRPVLIGRGRGGALALTLAVQAPGLPGRLVLVDSLPVPTTADLRRVRCPTLVLGTRAVRRPPWTPPGVRFALLKNADDLDGLTDALRHALGAGRR